MQASIPVILGPTASGKTKLAVALANRWNGEIISADSRQVYKDLHIGTGKDYETYIIAGKHIPYHIIDCCSPLEVYTVSRFLADAHQSIGSCFARNHIPIVCGGTGLYLQALIAGMTWNGIPANPAYTKELETRSDEELIQLFTQTASLDVKARVDTSNRKRLIRGICIAAYINANPDFELPATKPYTFQLYGIHLPLALRRTYIAERLAYRLQHGLIEEGEYILHTYGSGVMHRLGLEYRYLALYLTNQLSYAQMEQQLTTAIQQYAKRQMTWYRKMMRSGISIQWLDGTWPVDRMLYEITNHYHNSAQ